MDRQRWSLKGPSETHGSDAEEEQRLTASVQDQLSQRILYARNKVKEDNPDFKQSRVDKEADKWEKYARKKFKEPESRKMGIIGILEFSCDRRIVENFERNLDQDIRDNKNDILGNLLRASKEAPTIMQDTSSANRPSSSEGGSASGGERLDPFS